MPAPTAKAVTIALDEETQVSGLLEGPAGARCPPAAAGPARRCRWNCSMHSPPRLTRDPRPIAKRGEALRHRLGRFL
jgi:hypothetical protein